MTPQVHLAYVPRGVALACALVYLKKDPDLYGWWIGAADSTMSAAYFKLEAFYSAARTMLYVTEGSDLYGGWRFDLTSGTARPIDPIPVEPELAHELERTQDAFSAEWLTFADDPGAEREHLRYREAELAFGPEVNLRFQRLNKLDRGDPVWRHYSRAFERAVLDFLGPRWPLDYGKT